MAASSRKSWLKSIAVWLPLLVLGVTLLLFAVAYLSLSPRYESRAIAMVSHPGASQEPSSSTEFSTRLTVRPMEALSVVFERAGFSIDTMHQILKSDRKFKSLRYIKPGETLSFYAKEGLEGPPLLDRLVYKPSANAYRYEFTKGHKSDLFKAKKLRNKMISRTQVYGGVIKGSLYESARRAGMSNHAIMTMASIFRFKVDFAHDILPGKRFDVILETLYDPQTLSPIDTQVQAARLETVSGDAWAYRLEKKDGDLQGFYDEHGKSLSGRFLRMPIKFARISSSFNLHRVHPLYKTVRPHKGTDFAAKRGTPILATGSGRIAFIGKKRGYGNVIYLDHKGRYQTRYAHMSGFARSLRRGSRIRQGQVIGYVGSTGYATGPHVHYEFRYAGRARDSQKYALPGAPRLTGRKLSKYLAQTKALRRAFQEHAIYEDARLAGSLPEGLQKDQMASAIAK